MHFSIEEFKKKVTQLLRENTAPEQIALGSAVGVFVGLSPFYGFHTLIAIAIAFLVKKANKIAMLLAIQISLPPFVPIIYFIEYKVGKVLLLRDENYSEKFFDTDLSIYAKFNLKFLATLVGSVIVGIIAAVLTYFICLFLVKQYRLKIAKKKT